MRIKSNLGMLQIENLLDNVDFGRLSKKFNLSIVTKSYSGVIICDQKCVLC